MKYKVTLNGKIYEIEVERGEAILAAEYEAAAPDPSPAPVPASDKTAASPVAPAAPAAASAPAQAAKTPLATGEKVPSPMPGVILDVRVQQGQVVKTGQVVLIIESMKMENEITAPRDGTVAQVAVAKGQTVATDDPLIILA